MDLTNEVPEIKEDESVIVVGNGPGILGSKMGEKIDSYDHVWRFNQCAINGFEEDVGTKTTMWFSFRPHRSGKPPHNISMCRLPKPKHLDGVDKTHLYPVTMRNDLRMIIHYEIRLKLGFDVNTKKVIPSSGLMAVWYLLKSCNVKRVDVVGFDNFLKQNNKSHHYWHKSIDKPPSEHSGIAEDIIFGRLEKAGFIKNLNKQFTKSNPYILPKKESDRLRIICVLKSGGDYNYDDVKNLARNIKKSFKCDYEFICYSDVDEAKTDDLVHCLPGWWSKLEIFRETGPCIYFDLDVYIPGDMTPLADWVLSEKGRIAMLEEWKPSWRSFTKNSTIVAWNGDFSYVTSNFDGVNDRKRFRGDQEYITATLEKFGEKITHVQDIISGCYSYKRHCKKTVPEDARFIGFHGKPRPRELGKPYWSADFSGDFFFIHVPKTGGVSIHHALKTKGYISEDHLTAIDLRKKYGEDVFSGKPSYAIIRNPFERVVSAYFFAKKRNSPVCKRYKTFNDFAMNIDSVMSSEKKISVFWPQHRFVHDEYGNLIAKLYLFEKIDKFWSDLNNNHYSSDFDELPCLNQTDYPDWRKLYTRETRRKIAKAYAKDIGIYNSLKNGEKNECICNNYDVLQERSSERKDG